MKEEKKFYIFMKKLVLSVVASTACVFTTQAETVFAQEKLGTHPSRK